MEKDLFWLLSLEDFADRYAVSAEGLDDWSEIVLGCRFRLSVADRAKPCNHEDCGTKIYDPDHERQAKALAN